jgi:hypothetical protein
VVNIGRLIDEMVTSLARCKANKNVMLLGRLSQRWRHGRLDDLFHGYDDVPGEAARIVQA